MKYKPSIVTAYFATLGIPAPEYEFRFHGTRKWRFDLAFPAERVAIEVQGGIWVAGGHNRGAQMLKDWEKYNEAACLGWRLLYCQPKDLTMLAFAETVKRALTP